MAHAVTELREYAHEHLFYEIWMTATLTARMRRHAALFDEGLSASDGPLAEELLELTGRNADIESFATHVRNLFFFLYGKKAKPSDVVAANYFEDRNDWFSVRPVRPKSLARINERVPVEIGHLSFGRLRENDKTWPYEEMWRDLAKALDVFLDHVPADRVSTEFRQAAKVLLSPYSQPETIRDFVSALNSDSLIAGLGATTLPAELYRVADDPYPHDSGAGTAVIPPKREIPGFGD